MIWILIPDDDIIDVDMIPDEHIPDLEEVLIATLYKITSLRLKFNKFAFFSFSLFRLVMVLI